MSSNQKRTKVIIYTHFSQTKKTFILKTFYYIATILKLGIKLIYIYNNH